MRVLLTGATGLVGHQVGKLLAQEGHKVVIVSRDREKALRVCPFACEVIEGDLTAEAIKADGLRSIHGVIHLAGESVAEARWTAAKKKRIYDSRALGTAHLIESLKEAKAPLVSFVSTSASGYYGDRGDEVLTENSPGGAGFLADVCRDWERPVELAEKKNIFPSCRYVTLRVAMVLSSRGGALAKMIPLFRWGLGSPIGSGQQWMGWIHIEDLARIYLQSLVDKRFHGVINAVAPQVVNNREFTAALAAAFGKSPAPAVPRAVLKLIFGEMAHVLLSSQRLPAQKLEELGYSYAYPTIESALSQVRDEFFKNEKNFVTSGKN